MMKYMFQTQMIDYWQKNEIKILNYC